MNFKLLYLFFLLFLSISTAYAAKSEIIQFEGYTFYDGEKVKDKREIKVGGVLEAKGDVSHIDSIFQGAVFRIVGGKVSLEKSFLKPQKGQKDGMQVLSGKAYFYIDKRIHDSQITIKTTYCNFYVNGDELKTPAIFIVNKLKDRVAIYVHQGVVNVTIQKSKKIKLKITEKQSWEYKDGPPPEPTVFSDERRINKMLPIFEALQKI